MKKYHITVEIVVQADDINKAEELIEPKLAALVGDNVLSADLMITSQVELE